MIRLKRSLSTGAQALAWFVALAFVGMQARGEVRAPVFGADAYIVLPATVTLAGDFTVEYWFKTARATNWRLVNFTNNYNYTIGHASAASIQLWSPAQTLALNQPFAVLAWEHIAIVRAEGGVNIYRNGYLAGGGLWTGQIRLNQIGGSPSNSGWAHYAGQAAEVRLWNHARPAEVIRNQMNGRMTGAEPGLLGYWPLDEGADGTAHDRSPAGNHGTFLDAAWDDAGPLPLSDFVVEHPVTGSRRFTGTNTLSVARFRRVDGYTHWQVTEGDALPNPGAEFWTSTLTPPATVSFTRPAVDTNVTLTAWFTNLAEQVALRGDRTTILYTTVLPQPSLRTSLSRERVQGSSVIVHPADIDTGSAGGSSQGEPLNLHRAMVTVRSGPDTDGAPDDPWIAVSQPGDYTLGLALMNEAGNTVESAESCVLSVTAFSGAFSWTGVADSDWFNVMNWLPNGVPGDGDDVTVGSGSVEVTNATAALRSLIVSNGATLAVSGWNSALQATDMTLAGTVTHAVNDVAATNSLGEWVPQHRVLLTGSNITVAAGGLIDANGKGYRKMQGPGSRGALSGGAGHAGEGGFTHVHGNHGGPGYGDPAAPEQPGSGGGHDSYGSSGGGAVRMVASGALTIDGTLQADALDSSGSYGSGGSGGSIWISCRTLAGADAGRLSVKGGNGWYWGGGGAGGRIAIDYHPPAQAGLPLPGLKFDGTPGKQPADNWETFRAWMGSLHLPDTRLIDGNLTGKQFQWVQVHIPGWACWEREALILDDCVLGLPEGVALNVTNSLTLTNGAALHVHAAPATNVLTDFGLEVHVGGNLNVHAVSWILPYAQPTNGAVVRFTVDGDLLVAAGGGFDANRRGYTRGYGYNTIIRGAGHGGHSGMGFDGVGWAEPYDDLEFPVQAGSGGSASHAASGRGGGAILLFVEGDAELHGSLLADGSCGMRTHGNGGSGGSILVACRTVQGSNSALLSADGGLADGNTGSGGGGRIAMHYDPVAQAALPVPPIRFSAFAPKKTTANIYRINAQDGTLWLPDNLWLTERIDQGRFRNVRLFTPVLDQWAPASLTLDDCILALPEGFTLQIAGDLVMTNDAGLHLSAAPTNATGARYGAELRVGRDLLLFEHAWIHPQAHTNDGAIVGIRVGRHVAIADGGGIDATGRGYQGTSGNSIGAGAGRHSNAGGGYGGTGGVYTGLTYSAAWPTYAGRSHGSPVLPLQPGSPAGWRGRSGYGVGGGGGGAIHLLAGGTVRIDGTLVADGWNGCYWSGSGGSGGAVFVAGRRVTGSGRISVKGGAGTGDGGSGGGGRVAIWYGMGLAEIAARLEHNMLVDLQWHAPGTRFTGQIDLGWHAPASTRAIPPTEGSAGLYCRSATMFIVR